MLAIPNHLSAQITEDSCDVKIAQAATSPHPKGATLDLSCEETDTQREDMLPFPMGSLEFCHVT